MMHNFCSKLMTMKVWEGVPSIDGKAWKEGTQMTVNSGTCQRYSSAVEGRTNMLRGNWLCQADSGVVVQGVGGAPPRRNSPGRIDRGPAGSPAAGRPGKRTFPR